MAIREKHWPTGQLRRSTIPSVSFSLQNCWYASESRDGVSAVVSCCGLSFGAVSGWNIGQRGTMKYGNAHEFTRENGVESDSHLDVSFWIVKCLGFQLTGLNLEDRKSVVFPQNVDGDVWTRAGRNTIKWTRIYEQTWWIGKSQWQCWDTLQLQGTTHSILCLSIRCSSLSSDPTVLYEFRQHLGWSNLFWSFHLLPKQTLHFL